MIEDILQDKDRINKQSISHQQNLEKATQGLKALTQEVKSLKAVNSEFEKQLEMVEYERDHSRKVLQMMEESKRRCEEDLRQLKEENQLLQKKYDQMVQKQKLLAEDHQSILVN